MKRKLSVLLIAALLLSSMPTPAFAAGSSGAAANLTATPSEAAGDEEISDEDELLATASDADGETNFLGLTPDELPAEPFMGISLFSAENGEDGSEAPKIQEISQRDWSKQDPIRAISFTYETVSGKEKLFALTDDMNVTYGILIESGKEFSPTDASDYAVGFYVRNLYITVKNGSSGEQVTFYPTSIENLQCKVTAELTSGKKFDAGRGVWHCGADDDAVWNELGESEYIISPSGSALTIKMTPAYAMYAAYSTQVTETGGEGKAVLFYSKDDASLGDIPRQDAEAMKETLQRLNEFKAENIEIVPLETNDNTGSEKQKMKDKLHDMFSQNGPNSLSFVYYSGHGGNAADQSSYLALGGEGNSVFASELRQWLSSYDGKFTVVLDCCYSGGMLLAMNDGEEDESGDGYRIAQSREEAEAVSARLAEAFQTSVTGYDPSRFSIITAASYLETSMQYASGGQLTVALDHALGYDRYNALYNTYAADTDKDGVITMKELSGFYNKQAMVSDATLFPAESTEPLFTYDSNTYGGVPALFDAGFDDSLDKTKRNVTLTPGGDAYNLSVTTKVKNLSDDDKTFKAAIFPGEFMLQQLYLGSAGDIKAFILENSPSDAIDYQLFADSLTLAANQEGQLSFNGTIPKNFVGSAGYLLIRIWCEDGGNSDFVTPSIILKAGTRIDGSTQTGMNRAALKFKSPVQTADSANAVTISTKSLLPITVRFDAEPVDKTGAADCRLTLKAYRDGEADPVATIYENYLPSYGRYEIDGARGGQTSTYEYVWDLKSGTGTTSGLGEGTYRLELTCDYTDGGTPAQATARTYFTVAEDAADRLISEYTLGMDKFPELQSGLEVDITYKEATERMQNFLKTSYANEYSDEHTYKVTGWKYRENADASWSEEIPPDSDDEMQAGDYIMSLKVTIPDGADVRFTPDCVLNIPWHEVENTVVTDTTDGVIGGKTITADVYHRVPDISGNDIRIEGELKAGSEVKITSTNQNADVLCVYPITNTEYGDKIKPNDQGKYKIAENADRIEVTLVSKGSGCCCGAYTKSYEIAPPALRLVSAPDQTVYIAKGASTLDLSGASISRDGAEALPLAADMLEGWSDSYLKTPGVYPVTVVYDGVKLEAAFEVQVVYSNDGSNLKVDNDIRFSFSEDGIVKGTFSVAAYDEHPEDIGLIFTRKDTATSPTSGAIGLDFALKDIVRSDDRASITRLEDLYAVGNSGEFGFLVPYPKGTGMADSFSLTEKDGSSKASLKKTARGLWLTVNRGGRLEITYKKTGSSSGGGGSSSTTSSSYRSDWSYVVGEDGTGRWVCRLPGGAYASDGWYELAWNGANHWYYFDKSGTMLTGWLLADNRWYYLDKDGAMRTGWLEKDGKWYYFNKNGSMAVGWIQDKGKWYYFDITGAMLTITVTPDGYAVGADGAWLGK